METTLQPTSCSWRGLDMGPGTRYRIRAVDGWEERPAARWEKKPRTNGHGAHRTRVWADERLVVVEGWCWSGTERDQLLAGLQRTVGFGDSDDTEPLTITAAGRTLTAGAQLVAARPMLLRGEWGVGRFGWLLQWRCPDPLRYGPPQTASTGLPTQGGGLAYPLNYPLDYGAPGVTGQITLTNPGSAAAPILFAVRGGLEQGFELAAAGSGERLRYPVPVPARQVIELDTDTGRVLVEGTASRRVNLTHADWMRIPPADPRTGEPGTLSVQFTSLGGAPDPGALLSATWSEAHW